jgi:hypothetical protein
MNTSAKCTLPVLLSSSLPTAIRGVTAISPTSLVQEAPGCLPFPFMNEISELPVPRDIARRLVHIAEAALAQDDFKSALKAYELLGKHLGMFTEKTESTLCFKTEIQLFRLPDNGRSQLPPPPEPELTAAAEGEKDER